MATEVEERSPWEGPAPEPVPEREPGSTMRRGLIGIGVVLLLAAFAVNGWAALFVGSWDPAEDCEIASDRMSSGIGARFPLPASVVCDDGTQLVPIENTVAVIPMFALGCVLIAAGRGASVQRAAVAGVVSALVPALIYGAVGWIAVTRFASPAVVEATEVPRTDISAEQARSGMQSALDAAMAVAGDAIVPVGDPSLPPTVHEWACLDGGREYAFDWSFGLAATEASEQVPPETLDLADRIGAAWQTNGWIDDGSALSYIEGPGGGGLSAWPTVYGISVTGRSACVDATDFAGPTPVPSPLGELRFDLSVAVAQAEMRRLADAALAAGTEAGGTWLADDPGTVSTYECGDALGSTVSFRGTVTTGPVELNVNEPFPTEPPPGDEAVMDRIAAAWTALGYPIPPGARDIPGQLREDAQIAPSSSALGLLRLRLSETGVVVEVTSPCIAN